eukprot:GHRR01017140.1.p1 GENE.GHRR01017140.1~~GHRR01017140.1.p1  ORF type:complete len:139 (-),score=50.38 GHRR01017140.1:1451-1867(-)
MLKVTIQLQSLSPNATMTAAQGDVMEQKKKLLRHGAEHCLHQHKSWFANQQDSNHTPNTPCMLAMVHMKHHAITLTAEWPDSQQYTKHARDNTLLSLLQSMAAALKEQLVASITKCANSLQMASAAAYSSTDSTDYFC